MSHPALVYVCAWPDVVGHGWPSALHCASSDYMCTLVPSTECGCPLYNITACSLSILLSWTCSPLFWRAIHSPDERGCMICVDSRATFCHLPYLSWSPHWALPAKGGSVFLCTTRCPMLSRSSSHTSCAVSLPPCSSSSSVSDRPMPEPLRGRISPPLAPVGLSPLPRGGFLPALHSGRTIGAASPDTSAVAALPCLASSWLVCVSSRVLNQFSCLGASMSVLLLVASVACCYRRLVACKCPIADCPHLCLCWPSCIFLGRTSCHWSEGFRFGEALHRGAEDVLSCVVTNPTAVHNKVAEVLELQADVVCLAETSAFASVQASVAKALHAQGVRSFFCMGYLPPMPVPVSLMSSCFEPLGIV